jgi:hypothetical protein
VAAQRFPERKPTGFVCAQCQRTVSDRRLQLLMAHVGEWFACETTGCDWLQIRTPQARFEFAPRTVARAHHAWPLRGEPRFLVPEPSEPNSRDEHPGDTTVAGRPNRPSGRAPGAIVTWNLRPVARPVSRDATPLGSRLRASELERNLISVPLPRGSMRGRLARLPGVASLRGYLAGGILVTTLLVLSMVGWSRPAPEVSETPRGSGISGAPEAVLNQRTLESDLALSPASAAVDAPQDSGAAARFEDPSASPAPDAANDPGGEEGGAEAGGDEEAFAEEAFAEEQLAGGPSALVGVVTPPGAYQAASMHQEPSTSAPMIQLVPGGELVHLLGERAVGGGYPWARVRTADGHEGWVIDWAITVLD